METQSSTETKTDTRDRREGSLENSWPPVFLEHRCLHDNKGLTQLPGDLGNDGVGHEEEEIDDHDGDDDDAIDNLDIFLKYPGEIRSQSEVKTLINYCRASNPHDEEPDVITTENQSLDKVAWIDDRVAGPELEGSGIARIYENPLGISEFRNALEKSRFGEGNLPDAARRVIYCQDVSPACVEILAQTATCLLAPVLRNAIYNYLKFQTSIGVQFPSHGYLIYQLNLHLPFFKLSDKLPEKVIGTPRIKPDRKWTDLSFLNFDTVELSIQRSKKVWGMYETMISIVVTGSDEFRWLGCGFVDSKIDGELSRFSKADLNFDRVSAGELSASLPFWRPRDYFIRIFEIRIEQVKKEWEYLLSMVEPSFHEYHSKHRSTLSGPCSRSARERAAEQKKAFDWTVDMMNLLRQINSLLSNTNEALRSFFSPEGDFVYFRDSNQVHASRSLPNIRVAFRCLEEYQRRVIYLKECCFDFSRDLELCLTLESKVSADQSGVTSDFIAVIVYPVALSAGIFSMQLQVIPFDPNPSSFVLAALILMAMSYSIRFILRHAPSHWPSWQKVLSQRNKAKKSEKACVATTRSLLGDNLRSMMGLSLGVVIEDLERQDPSRVGTTAAIV